MRERESDMGQRALGQDSNPRPPQRGHGLCWDQINQLREHQTAAAHQTSVCVHRKQSAMWLLGDSQRSQKIKTEERAVSHLITTMDDLALNPAHNSTNFAHNNSSMFGSPSSDRLTDVRVSLQSL